MTEPASTVDAMLSEHRSRLEERARGIGWRTTARRALCRFVHENPGRAFTRRELLAASGLAEPADPAQWRAVELWAFESGITYAAGTSQAPADSAARQVWKAARPGEPGYSKAAQHLAP